MNEIATVPQSIRQRLDQARQLAIPDPEEAVQRALRDAFVELARHQPELCTLLMAGKLGYEGFSETTYEQSTTMERTPKTFLGIQVGEEWVPVTTTKMVSRTFRLF